MVHRRIYITADALPVTPLVVEELFVTAFRSREEEILADPRDLTPYMEVAILYEAAAMLLGADESERIYQLAQPISTPAPSRVISASAIMKPAFLSPTAEDDLYDLSLFPYGDGAKAGTPATRDAMPSADGRWAGTSVTPTAKQISRDGGRAGTSSEDETLTLADIMHLAYGGETGYSTPSRPKQTSHDGGQAGTPATRDAKSRSDGATAGTSAYDGRWTGTAHADGWKAGRHVRTDGAGAGVAPSEHPLSSADGRWTGTPLQQAAEKFNDGAKAGTPWHPLDDVAVDGRQAGYGSYDEAALNKHIGRGLARLIAIKTRGR